MEQLKKSALPMAVALAAGLVGGKAIPQNVQVDPQSAMHVLEAASAQDIADTMTCQAKLRNMRLQLNKTAQANRLLATKAEAAGCDEVEQALKACAEKLALKDAPDG